MRAGSCLRLKSRGATSLLAASLLLALSAIAAVPLKAQEGEGGAGNEVEQPADVAPDAEELMPGGDAGELGEQPQVKPKQLDRSFMRPDLKEGSEGVPPPHSAGEKKQDRLAPSAEDLPLPTPEDKPKRLGELYQQLASAKDAEAAGPIMESIETLWRRSGSDTVDLLVSRAEHFAKDDDLDLALKIIDAAVGMAPDDAEAWHLRAKVHFLKKDYELAIADLKRALERDPKHYAALNDLGVALESTGAKKEALAAYRKALAINPFLDETKKTVDELHREVEGQDI
jgi:tetratricopeptide (TPR) repeat protein